MTVNRQDARHAKYLKNCHSEEPEATKNLVFSKRDCFADARNDIAEEASMIHSAMQISLFEA